MPLASLDSLSPLASISDLGTASSAASVASAVAGAASTASGGQGWLTRGVVIVLGLLLVAAGIFSFDRTRELVVQAGKAAAIAA